MIKKRQIKSRQKTSLFFLCIVFLIAGGLVYSAENSAEQKTPITTARAAVEAAAKEDSVSEGVSLLKKIIPSLTSPAEKRSAISFLGSVQEQLGLYSDAGKSYASAAAIAAGDADEMPKKSSEQLVLDAVRCALSSGDSVTADKYLNSAVRSSSNETIVAYVKLYEQWSALCRAEKKSDTEEPVALLKTYSELPSMKAVAPAILLTLWHITGEDSYGEKLKKQFPLSAESAIVKGEIQLLPAPFWYFAPRTGSAVPEVAQEPASSALASSSSVETDSSSSGKDESSSEENNKIVLQQLGLFKEKSNAESLVEQLGKKGFSARITTEKRASGTTYFIVVVDENESKSMGAELRNAGFECYPVFSE